MEMNRAEVIRTTGELMANREACRFMLSALRVALASAGGTPQSQSAILLLREQLQHWRAERLSLGPQPELEDDDATAVHAAFRQTFADQMAQVENLLREFD